MKLQNVNPELIAQLDANVDKTVDLTVTGDLAFCYGDVKLRYATCYTSADLAQESGAYMVSRPGSPEISFLASAVRKIYFGPSRKLSIYI